MDDSVNFLVVENFLYAFAVQHIGFVEGYFLSGNLFYTLDGFLACIVKLLAASVPDVDMNGLRDLGDQLKEKLGSGVVVLASAKDGKVSLLAMVTDDAMKKGAHAGKLIKEVAAVVGGGGGGRPNMAQAGGKNPEKIDEAVAKAAEVLEGQIA